MRGRTRHAWARGREEPQQAIRDPSPGVRRDQAARALCNRARAQGAVPERFDPSAWNRARIRRDARDV